MTATSTDGESTATTSGTIDVYVDAVADAPTLTLQDVSGDEDSAIALDVSAALTDAGETLTVEISGIPDGATLTADGQAVTITNGVATLTANQLDGLEITPSTNSSDDFQLSVTATSTDGESTATTSGTIDVSVSAVADAPTLTVQNASGDEDSAIALDVSAALTDAGETLSVEISGVPDGATLTVDGQAVTVTNGVATLGADQLDSLEITPPTNSSDDFQLTVTATSTDGTDTATTSGTIDVSVAGQADAPTLSAPSQIGGGETFGPGDTYSVDYSGSTGRLTARGYLDAEDGGNPVFTFDNPHDTPITVTYEISGQGVTGSFVAPANSRTVFAAEGADGQATLTARFTNPDTDASQSYVKASGGSFPDWIFPEGYLGEQVFEDTEIPLDIQAALTDTDGSETLTIEISGIPDGATLTHDGATVQIVDGVAEIDGATLGDLAITPPANYSGTMSLGVTAVSSEDGTTASTSATIDVVVDAVADDPTLSVSDASGVEDQQGGIALDISAAVTDDSESLSVEISGIPDGATLTADGQAVTVTNGVATLSADQLDSLAITPPSNASDDFQLTVTATSTDGEDTATTSGVLTVTVDGVADTPTLQVSDASGVEDAAIALDISAALTDSSETLSVAVSGIPSGATLTADGQAITVNNGVATLSADQLENLEITPPENASDDFQLTVTATSTDGSDTATTSGTIDVSVAADADAPTLTLNDVSGVEDQVGGIALDLSAGTTDDSETLSVEISGIPDGATLTADGAAITVTDGVATLTAEQVDNLVLTPATDANGIFTLSVSATSTDGTDTATTSGTMVVTVAPDADAPTLTVTDVSGVEDQVGGIALDISAAVTDAGETLSVEISGIPDGATLTADGQTVTVSGGTATLTAEQLDNLVINPPANSSDTINLDVRATSTDGTDTAVTTGSIAVTVAAVADDPTLTVSDASGVEDQEGGIELDISAAVTDAGETLSVEISGIPDGSTLTAGGVAIAISGGVALLSAGQLDDLVFTPPANASG